MVVIVTCIHHWVIEEAGREVEGRCKHCGEVKMFNGVPPFSESFTGYNERGRFQRTVEDAGAARRRGAKHGNATRKAQAGG